MVTGCRPILQQNLINLREELPDVDEMVHMEIVGQEGEYDIPNAAEEPVKQRDLSLDVLLARRCQLCKFVGAFNDFIKGLTSSDIRMLAVALQIVGQLMKIFEAIRHDFMFLFLTWLH